MLFLLVVVVLSAPPPLEVEFELLLTEMLLAALAPRGTACTRTRCGRGRGWRTTDSTGQLERMCGQLTDKFVRSLDDVRRHQCDDRRRVGRRRRRNHFVDLVVDRRLKRRERKTFSSVTMLLEEFPT